MQMSIQEFYSEANEIVELHKAYGNIIDWDKERPVNWGAIHEPPQLFPPACAAAEHYKLVHEMENETPLVNSLLSEMA